MPDPVTALIVGGTQVAGSLIGSDAAGDAAEAQTEAGLAGVQEVRAAREEMRKLLQPWVSAGGEGLTAQMDLLGLGEPGAQEAAVGAIESSPMFQALARQGEDAILQNFSATGGLRGGNVQGALAQFRPALLNDQINQQYGRLAELSRVGQASAAGVGTSGIDSASQVAQLFGEIGAAKAGGELGKAQAWGGLLNLPAQFAGLAMGGAF